MEHRIGHRMELASRRGVSRIEVLDGPTGRRRWPDDLKARIVSGSSRRWPDDLKARIVSWSLLPGARLRCGAEGWVGGAASFRMARLRCLAGDYIAEKVARKGKLVLPGGDTAVFVPVVVEPLAVGRPAIPMTEAGAVRIEIAGVVLPVGSDCGPDRAAAIEDAAGRCAEGSAVIFPGQAVRIEIAVSPGDFRKGHDGLASMAQAELGFAPKAGVMVVFRSKRGDPLPGNRCLQR